MNRFAARGPRYRQFPLWRDAQRFLLEVECAVRNFPRYHKYTLGSELRRQAMDVNRVVARAAQHAHLPVLRRRWPQIPLSPCTLHRARLPSLLHRFDHATTNILHA